MSAFSTPTCYDRQRWSGLRVGLLGGSFHPPHTGHIRLSRKARKALKLDFVWWLVTPKNPIKKSVHADSFHKRLASAQDFTADYPYIIVSDLEHELNCTYTYETLCSLKKRFSETALVWLCGYDLAHNFHRWHKSSALPFITPFAFFARPPATQLIAQNRLRMRSDLKHVFPSAEEAAYPSLNAGIVYWLPQQPMYAMSSSQLRRNE